MSDLDPHGAMEEELVEQIVLYAWRLRRAARIETDVLANEMTEDQILPSGNRQPSHGP